MRKKSKRGAVKGKAQALVMYLSYGKVKDVFRYDGEKDEIYMSAMRGYEIFGGMMAAWMSATRIVENNIGWVPFEKALKMYPEEEAIARNLPTRDGLRQAIWKQVKSSWKAKQKQV